jgi:hypothetical protein
MVDNNAQGDLVIQLVPIFGVLLFRFALPRLEWPGRRCCMVAFTKYLLAIGCWTPMRWFASLHVMLGQL